MQIREELLVDELTEIVPGERLVVVQPAVRILGRSPALPAVLLVEDVAVLPALECRLGSLVLLKVVQILQE